MLAPMWTKRAQLSATGTSRPVRVAYLIDIADCPDELLDVIFAEAYSRWGGRRTLIVPATADGIDARYGDWLWYFDADIIYSFVALSDEAVAALHERFAPARLVHHEERGVSHQGARSFAIRLPFESLTSLSVLPVFLSRSWGFGGPPRDVRILDKFWDKSESRFLQENFGFLRASLPNASVATAHPDLFSCLTLITKESLQSQHLMKDSHARYETREDELLDALAQQGWLLTVANLSEWFAPFLDTGDGFGLDGMTVVAGDTPADRLLYWNAHHRHRRAEFTDTTSLRIPASRLSDEAFVGRVRKIIERRGVRGHNGRNDFVTLHSCSLDQSVLDEAAERLRKIGSWLAVRVARHLDHAACVPRFRDHHRVSYGQGSIFSEPAGQAKTEFNGSRLLVPRAMPWHMSEAMPPPALRQGNWMIDIVADRLVDHCRYSNHRHVWVLPRRLRLERLFDLEREADRSLRHDDDHFIRPTRSGSLGIAMRVGISMAALTMPDDLEALEIGLCNDREWLPFDPGRKSAPIARHRFAYSTLSDKGRYLIGVLQLFQSMPNAFAVLMDDFWRDVLRNLGAVPSEKNVRVREQLIATLRKRLNQTSGPLRFETEEHIERLGREALRFGRMLPRERRYVDHAWLQEKWRALVDEYLKAHSNRGDVDDDADIRDMATLNRSIQHLCQNEVLFQGREWSCRSCHNRNWVSIDSLARALECEVCRHSEPAPVSGDWHFRGNAFLLEAYREHGVEAVIFALWQLSERARQSFYFAPSLRLWLKYPKSSRHDCDAEIDALAVVDGETFLVEAKTTAALDEHEIAQLVLAGERIRPDVVLIACMEDETAALRGAVEKLRSTLPRGIGAEVLTFKTEMLHQRPFLPS